MKKMTEAQVRTMAFGRKRGAEFGERHRDPAGKRRFLVLTKPRRGRSYGAECFENELTELRGESLSVQILWQSRAFKRAGAKEFTGEFFSPRAARAARMDARTE
ncbi:MAG: hypothetical protein Q7S84_03660 [bacterium]|nr:hypothetical protein [bacterium]